MWKEYLTEEAYESLSRFGYYHMMHPNSNLRIISTWSLTFDNMNWFLMPNNTDPLGQLRFLENTLLLSEKEGNDVIIIGHIPPGDVFSMSEWSWRFRAVIHRFSNIIRGQYYGHTHYDEFHVIRSYNESELSSGTVWVVGSLTSYPFKNPGLRVWYLDPDTYHIQNFN